MYKFISTFFRCGQNQFYDSLAQHCYSIKCGFLYTNVGGR